MKKLLPLFILIISATGLGQDITATTSDGKSVILKPDKTWIYKSETLPETKKIFIDDFKNFTGDDLDEFRKAVFSFRKDLEKSEFETKEQYYIRLENFVKQAKFKNKTLAETILVFTPDFRYDADTQEFYSASSNIDSVLTRIFFVGKSSYGNYSNEGLTTRFKISPEKAQEAKPDLRLAVHGYPVEPFVNSIQFYPTKVFCFNNRTGEVYAQKALGEETNTNNGVSPIVYVRPGFVKALKGETVATLAARIGANATEVAKLNGLLPNSILPEGREIKIPQKKTN